MRKKYLKFNQIDKYIIKLIIFSLMLILVGCSNKGEAKNGFDSSKDSYIRGADEVIEEPSDVESVKNCYDSLSVPTDIRKIKDTYFIVDCYHNQVLYHDNLSDPITEWSVMTDKINMGHTIASDGEVYLIDDTENHRVLVMREQESAGDESDAMSAPGKSFYLSEVFNDIGVRPHYIIYNEADDTFYVWSSMTGEMFLFRKDANTKEVYLTEKKSIPELNGFYVRSFTIIEDKIYFVSGNANIIEASLNDFSVIERYPVPFEMYGMVQLTRIEDYYYITISTDGNGSQDTATIIRTKSLKDLTNGEYEDVYSYFVGGGTPYCITSIGEKYYLCEHRLPGHHIWEFEVLDNDIQSQVTLY